MKFPLALIILLVLQLSCRQRHQPLFKIVQDQKIGYINSEGHLIIQPIFYSGSDFSEGLAAVRQRGEYGFIDETGSFVIAPEYDFAKGFSNGLAQVYKNNKSFFIDRFNKMVLAPVYTKVFFLGNGIASVTTNAGRAGVIDYKANKLLIDTTFAEVIDFVDNVAIVQEWMPLTDKQRNTGRLGVVNINRKMIVPFGLYQSIGSFSEGFAKIGIRDTVNDDYIDGVIDLNGNLLFTRPRINRFCLGEEFHEGYAAIYLRKYWLPEDGGVFSSSKVYAGYIDLRGEIVFNDTSITYAGAFAEGRAFAKRESPLTHTWSYILLDKNFKRVGQHAFVNIMSDVFKNGYAIVQDSVTEQYGIIDTSGEYVVKPVYQKIETQEIRDNCFFFTTSGDSELLYGMANLNGDTIVKPRCQEIDGNGFINGLLKVTLENKCCYLNKQGVVVWQQADDHVGKLLKLNTDVMMEGYFYAYSSPVTLAERGGGWAISENIPQPVTGHAFPSGSLAAIIDTTVIDTFEHRFMGFRIFISNTSPDTVTFNAQDSRLYMTLQAQTRKGDWLDLEYLRHSWCGNSYHQLSLEPQALWKFTMPVYHGTIPAKIRTKLVYTTGKDRDAANERVVYSNEINGSVNPGQFWVKQDYYPANLMDPYGR